MAEEKDVSAKKHVKKEWTLMFYFASDNPLAPEIVSQLKTLKNAGYHQGVNVVAYFDPLTVGTPAHIFDVNGFEKLRTGRSKIGFGGKDPYVRNLMFDKLWSNEQGRRGTPIRDLIQAHAIKKPDLIYDLPTAPRPENREPSNAGNLADGSSTHSESTGTSNSTSHFNGDLDQNLSLQDFLDFCASEEKYKAKHYMLFILGHGLVVGDDVFLYDEHAASSSVTLSALGDALRRFKDDIAEFATFELVSFHSCSMSSLEVAFELQDSANYMLASQGPAFVGSWPYRQILLRVFNDVAQGKLDTTQDVRKMVKKIFRYVVRNSTDYLLAGYSFDLCLCDLGRIADLSVPIHELSKALIGGLPKPGDKDAVKKMVTDCILLAHWKSQSFFNENYTDLYDFCYCLHDYCKQFSTATNNHDPYEAIQGACDKVMKALKRKDAGPIILAEFAGPESQYSHGFSLFFPWTRPTADRTIMREDKKDEDHKTEYERYRFNETAWFDFLKAYWGPVEYSEYISGSMRDTRKAENQVAGVAASKENEYENLVEDIASLMFNPEGLLDTGGALSGVADKPNPRSSTGDGCTCGSLKNYRRDTRGRSERSKSANPTGFEKSPKAFAQKKIELPQP